MSACTTHMWPLAAALAITATVGVLMPTADHHANATHAAQAQASQQQAARTAAAAQALCESTHGPGAAHWWDADGALVCAAEQRATAVASSSHAGHAAHTATATHRGQP